MHMKKILLAGFAAAALFLSACSDVNNKSNQVTYLDIPARITCTGLATGVMFDGYSSGRVTYEEGGRLKFVDAKTGGLVITEGECIVRYRP